MPKPPRDVTEALRDGGLPQTFTLTQLQWLAARNLDLADQGLSASFRERRLRWAFLYHDIIATIVSQPRTR